MKARILLFCVFVCLVFSILAADTSNPPALRLEEKPSFNLMGKALRNSRDPGTLLMLWLDFYKIESSVPKPVPGVEYGLYAFGKGLPPTTDKQLIYMAGYEVPTRTVRPKKLEATTVPAAKYAVFEHHGPVSNVLSTLNNIFAAWLPAHNLKPAAQFYFERYDARHKVESPESVIEIWVPVELLDTN
jgi:AraC family transcriptional regulator